MQFEVIRNSHKKSIVIEVSLFVVLAIVLVVRFTFAKYSLVQSIKIAEGTINYKVPDFKIMAMYKNDGNEDTEIDTMPESGYAINESKSYCKVNGSKDNNAKIYTDDNGNHVISKITRGSRCYIYFDKVLTAGETILGNVTVNSGTPDFSEVATTNEGVYKAEDDDGTSYYWRGAVDNNYLKFANKWWRIVRINGDGSIRLIYDGTEAHANGTNTSNSIAITGQKFNIYGKDNAYVGFKYTLGEVHGLVTKSNALKQLETWYTNNLVSYASKIDFNAGFCGDRKPSSIYTSSNGSGGTGTINTSYPGYIRLDTNKAPVLTCSYTSDLYTTSSSIKGNKSLTYPIGLISADEVSMAGGKWSKLNKNYYLYNGQSYWTLSPFLFNGSLLEASVIGVGTSGGISGIVVNIDKVHDIRPVINLRSDVKLTGTGTMSDPYIVN